jgi:uncharacterized lipoprotein YbaY
VIAILLPALLVSAAAMLTVCMVFASRAGVFAPVAEAEGVSSADTLIGSGNAMVRTQIAPPRQAEWQTVTLTSLSAVEDLLDSLEAHGIGCREVTVVGTDAFAVRWK